MFTCFYFLGFIDDKAPIHLAGAYCCLATDVMVIQPIWRLFAGADVWTKVTERLIITVLLLIGMSVVKLPNLHPWLDMVIACVVFLFAVFYIRHDVNSQLKEQSGDRVESPQNA